jgi:hypothetical protein
MVAYQEDWKGSVQDIGESKDFILPATSNVANDRTGYGTAPSCCHLKYTVPFCRLGDHRRLRLARILSHSHRKLQQLHFACQSSLLARKILFVGTARKAAV